MFFAFTSVNIFVTTSKHIATETADFRKQFATFYKKIFTSRIAHTHSVITLIPRALTHLSAIDILQAMYVFRSDTLKYKK